MATLFQQVALGECTASCEHDCVRVRILHYHPRTHFPRHAHASDSISLILHGGYIENSTVGSVKAGLGDVLIKPAHSYHANTFADCHTITIQLELPCGASDESWPRAVRDAGYSIRSASAVTRPLAAIHTLLHDHSGSCSTGDLADSLSDTLGAVASLSRGARSRPHWLSRAEREIRLNLHEPFRVRDLADSLRLHPGYLCRAFHNVHGCGVSEYTRRLRVFSAADLLTRSRRALCEVAADTGFSDQAHMTRAFREVLGVTPASFRRMLSK